LLPGVPETGEELAARWGEPHRVYHGPSHLRDVLDRLDLLAAAGEPVDRAVRLAAWFHDAVHTGISPADEHASAALAAELLGPVLEPAETAEVVRLVHLTARHDPPADDVAGQLLCDA